MRRTAMVVALACAVAAGVAIAATSATGPSTSQSPYVVPAQDGVDVRSILTVGDAVGGYRMVGIPDGIGAYKDGAGR